MGGGFAKQFLDLCGKPLLYYSLRTLLSSAVITDLVLVIREGDEEQIRAEVLQPLEADLQKALKDAGRFRPGNGASQDAAEATALNKLRAVVTGGRQRCGSVYSGLKAIQWECDTVFIHDAARPFIEEETLERLWDEVQREKAVAAAMPSKDTVKIADENGYVTCTPDRRSVWMMQTPQVFEKELICLAYEQLREEAESLLKKEAFAADAESTELKEKGTGPVGMGRTWDEIAAQELGITDDAMAAERLPGQRVKLIAASYNNFKVTTPEDMDAAWPLAMELQERWDSSLLAISVE